MTNFFNKIMKTKEKEAEENNKRIDKEFLDEYEELCGKYNRLIIPKLEYTPDAIVPQLEIAMRKKDLPEMPKEEKAEEVKEDIK